ncbi:MAG: hypothetical protein VW546_03250 [Gammaproteobacteria bacterium]
MKTTIGETTTLTCPDSDPKGMPTEIDLAQWDQIIGFILVAGRRAQDEHYTSDQTLTD